MDSAIYSLTSNGRTSTPYYAEIAAFADTWLAQAQDRAGRVLENYRAFRQAAGLPERTAGEAAFELLVLGVLLHEHGDEAANRPAWAMRLLARLAALQNRYPAAEKVIKALRGLVNGLTRDPQTPATAQALPAHRAVTCLRRWLRAQGWAVQAERLGPWEDYLAAIGPAQAVDVVDQAVALAADFAQQSEASLGQYTAGVDAYRVTAARSARFRYDAELILRTRPEYHLGMLGTELLNRAYHDRFRATPAKIVIVPPCLRARPDASVPGPACQAIQTPLGAKCQGCRPDCRIHQLTRLGEKKGFAVYSIPDDQLHKVCLASGQAGGKVGVVGLSCVLSNWTAGWEAERLDLPAQGLLLDYAGCAKHWHQPARPTNTNFKKLEELIGLCG